MSGFTQLSNFHPGYIAGRYYATLSSGGGGNNIPVAIDTIYFHPMVIPRPFKFNNGAVRIGTGGAGSSIKSAIWANSAISSRPVGAPLFADNTGAATTSSNATIVLALGAGTLAPGFYWFGAKYTGTVPTVYSTSLYDTNTMYYAGHAALPSPAVSAINYADAYANAMPTLAEGATFGASSNYVGLGFLMAA